MKLLTTTVAASIACMALSGVASAATYKLATNLPDTATPVRLINEFAKNVEQRTDGRVKFKLFNNSVLGESTQYFQQIQKDVIDAGLINAASLENLVPLYGAINLPYIFRSADEYKKIMLDPEVRKMLGDASAKHNFYPLGSFGTANRSVYSSKPLKSIADLKGKKLRCMPSETYVEMTKLMGAVPTPMAYGELFTALQTGVIDGGEGGLAGLIDSKLGEVAKFALVTKHARATDYIVISDKFRKKLSKEDFAIVQEEFDKVSAKSTDFADQVDDAAIAQAVKQYGVTVTEIDTTPLQKAVEPMYRKAMQDPAKAPLLKTILRITDRQL